MPDDPETLELNRVSAHVLLVTMNRPQAANAHDTRMGRELGELWSGLCRDPGSLRCVVLTGAGNAFCAGADLKERRGMSDEAWRRQHRVFEGAVIAMANCPLPIIAAVNGPAYGGGCEFALAADFIYAARRARFALTEVTLGIMPGLMGTQNLPRAVGLRRAKELILTGRPFDSTEALEWGLANRVCDDDRVLAEALDTAARIAANAPLATRAAKKSLSIASEVGGREGYELELEGYNRLVGTRDRIEGVQAFNDKRRPDFEGR